MIHLTIDGVQIEAKEGQSILSAAREHGIHIPTLCFLEGINEIGSCRICVVEVEGLAKLVTACNTKVKEGMNITTNSPAVIESRKNTPHLLMAEHKTNCFKCVKNGACELQAMAREYGIDVPNFKPSHGDVQHEPFDAHPFRLTHMLFDKNVQLFQKIFCVLEKEEPMSSFESRIVKFPSKRYGAVVPMKAIPGHFVTNHSHINYYIDLTTMKSRLSEVKQCAHVLAQQYANTTVPIDTIVCLDGTEIIGAFLARELEDAGHSIHNAHKSIYVITPERTANSQLFFRENVEPMVRGKNVILLMASVTTGISIRRGIECMGYYGGLIRGVATLFSAVGQMDGIQVNTIFTSEDIPGYASYDRHNCPFCQKNVPVEAIVNSFGYSKL